MVLYLCHLTLHDNVFFASREMGTLYETEKYLHNWALSFAFFAGSYIPSPYHLQGESAQRPGYLETDNEQNLLHLNSAGIYVFPALPIQWSYQINTFRLSHVAYYDQSKKLGKKGADRNYPNYGRAKELAVGSTYRTYIIAPDAVQIPRWIRLGKWASKIRVDAQPIPDLGIKPGTGEFICDYPLNPIDLPCSTRVLSYNRIVMPPVSLLGQAQLLGDYWELSQLPGPVELQKRSRPKDVSNQVCLPRGVSYGANTAAATP